MNSIAITLIIIGVIMIISLSIDQE